MKTTIILLILLVTGFITLSQPPKINNLDQAAYLKKTVGIKPDFIAIDGNYAWIVDDHQNRILKISPTQAAPLLTVTVPEACTSPIVGFGAIWVMSCTEKNLYKIDHNTGKVLAKIPTGIADSGGEMSLAIGYQSVWILTDISGVLTGVNGTTQKIEHQIKVLPNSYGITFGLGSVWISNYTNNSVQRINPATHSIIATISVGKKPRFIATDNQFIWTLNQGDGSVSKIDPSKNQLVANIDVQAVGGGGDIAAGNGKVWVNCINNSKPIQVIDQKTNRVETIYRQTPPKAGPFKVDGSVKIAKDYIWISGYHSKTVWVMKK